MRRVEEDVEATYMQWHERLLMMVMDQWDCDPTSTCTFELAVLHMMGIQNSVKIHSRNRF